MAPRPLNRKTFAAGPSAPVRIVHVGLGAFHRAHQAWFTDEVDKEREWGIAAFTGRTRRAAQVLSAQDGLYTLIERAAEGDHFQVIESIVAAYDGADLGRMRELIAAPTTAIVTITVTEAAYYLKADLTLDAKAAPVASDITLLRQSAAAHPQTMAGRLVMSLRARRDAGGGPIAIVSCDNLSSNGTAARNAVVGTAATLDEKLAGWIEEHVSFVQTSIDRITPRTTDADIAMAADATGYEDKSPVVTEPFRSWILSGDFPAGRPDWEKAGAVFVDDIEAFERRKLWLLNGAHSLLAYAGQLRGHGTVAEAIADKQCHLRVEDLWDEAERHLTQPGLQIDRYRADLLHRFANPRIAHHLAQIAMDGTSKLRMRAIPILCAERAAGRAGAAAARVIAAWIDFVQRAEKIEDAAADKIRAALALPGAGRTQAMVRLLDDDVAADSATVRMIEDSRGGFGPRQ